VWFRYYGIKVLVDKSLISIDDHKYDNDDEIWFNSTIQSYK
jgi:hypothetical protein